MNVEGLTISCDNTYLVFDLDDTLYPEIDFLRSGYRHILETMLPELPPETERRMLRRYHAGENVFEWVMATYAGTYSGLSIPGLVQAYREHQPSISMSETTAAFLRMVKERSIPAGLITDGRSSSQRNKLKALGLCDFFQDIIISEEFGTQKPHPANYRYFEQKYPGKQFYYIGDNTAKDFIVPLELGWKTICLKDAGHNIHRQVFGTAPDPHHIISSFGEIILA